MQLVNELGQTGQAVSQVFHCPVGQWTVIQQTQQAAREMNHR